MARIDAESSPIQTLAASCVSLCEGQAFGALRASLVWRDLLAWQSPICAQPREPALGLDLLTGLLSSCSDAKLQYPV